MLGIKRQQVQIDQDRNIHSKLSFYRTPPLKEISLDEFEDLAFTRIHLLRHVESAVIRSLRDEELKQFISKVEEKTLPLQTVQRGIDINYESQREKDNISHYILRLAFCRTDDLRKWFVTQETVLFRYRYLKSNKEEREALIKDLKLSYPVMTEEEKKSYFDFLKIATPQMNAIEAETEIFYKVPFEEASELVQKRIVYIRHGVAFVPQREILSIILYQFKLSLESDLQMCSKMLPKIEDDDRVSSIIRNLMNHSIETTDTAVSVSGSLSSGEVDKASAHFPLCMAHLHKKLREESHLKHGGRMQYGLFLKSIGLSLEEALVFWRQAFSRKITDDGFQKNYAYNIRHNYGQEGKRVSYPGYNCLKIITSNSPSAGDHHGCPFKHFGADSLRENLSRYRLPNSLSPLLNPVQVEELMGLAQKNHFQIACTRLLEYSRNEDNLETVINPAQFYELSKTSTLKK
ncbi:DNA primase large subunit-like protein [Rozella allomycis CSF55]|uniref:DNA primase large subunit n=1 Tax=Rozella allomycis (strain CSF55) TaxID=988480 RepID=A0A075AV46_ROZAC|nr:DNA primase large subunit, eukaryotic/archaeal domain-containing protein [Rozella allomycis CSF55]RKP21003.1 DNA primase large subunit-like protein [Rozella allomycis CSF55]|eukprot:EPZ34176.1 DNA primase large subunit, eukaryotic/archaeal domain-containing protein [Rozella allomycis CSF55]